MPHRISYPPFESLKHLENTGNFAVSKYYKLPFRPFYRHKFKMIVEMMDDKKYDRILDFGAGSGIFEKELLKHGDQIYQIDEDSIVPPFLYDAIICASTLEFCDLSLTIDFLYNHLALGGDLFIASPMQTALSSFYFKTIRNSSYRHSHQYIKISVRRKFKITDYKEWMGLYFAIKAQKH